MFDFTIDYSFTILYIVLLPVFVFAAVYAVIAFRQLLIADKEEDKTRQKSAIKILILTLSVMIATLLFWFYY